MPHLYFEMEALDSDLVYDDDFDHWSNVGEQDLLCLKVQNISYNDSLKSMAYLASTCNRCDW